MPLRAKKILREKGLGLICTFLVCPPANMVEVFQNQ